jgi:hypothetical protein
MMDAMTDTPQDDDDYPPIPEGLTGYDRLTWVLVAVRRRRPLTAAELAQVGEVLDAVKAERERLAALIVSLEALLGDDPIPRRVQ